LLHLDQHGVAVSPQGDGFHLRLFGSLREIHHQLLLVPAGAELWICRTRSCATLAVAGNPSHLSESAEGNAQNHAVLARYGSERLSRGYGGLPCQRLRPEKG